MCTESDWFQNERLTCFYIEKATKVAVLHFYVTGFRGDCKALKQTFSFNRDYNRNEAGGFRHR